MPVSPTTSMPGAVGTSKPQSNVPSTSPPKRSSAGEAGVDAVAALDQLRGHALRLAASSRSALTQ